MRARTTVIVSVLAAIAAAAGLAAGKWLHSPTFQSLRDTNRPTPLVVNASELDFGVGYDVGEYTHAIHLTNQSDVPVRVVEYVNSCSCTKIDPPAGYVLSPGETKDITLRFRFSPPDKSVADTSGRFSSEIGIAYELNGNRATSRWHVTGTVLPTLTVSHSRLFFPPCSELGPRPEWVLTVRTADYVRNVEVEVPVGLKAVVTSADEGQAVRAWTVRTSVHPKCAIGDITGPMRISPVIATGEKLEPRVIPVRGKLSRDIIAEPTSVQLGRRLLGSEVAEPFRFQSLTGKPFTLRSTDARLSATDDSLAPASQYAYVFRCRIGDRGERSERVTLAVTDNGGNEYDVSINVSYVGITTPE